MTDQEIKNDKFWLYVGGVAVSLIVVLILVKMNEDEKFEPIKSQLEEEAKLMNIRVLSN